MIIRQGIHSLGYDPMLRAAIDHPSEIHLVTLQIGPSVIK